MAEIPPTPTKGSVRFQQKLAYLSRVYAFTGPVGLLVTCVVIQFFFTNYFGNRRGATLLPLIFVLSMLFARIIKPNASRARLAFEYIVITALASLAFTYLLQFPSPYIIVGAIIGVLIYFDFGARWATLSLTIIYGSVIGAAIIKNLSFVNFVNVIAYVVGPATIAVFVIRLQSLARQEIEIIEASTAESLANEQQVQSLINNISDGVIAVNQKLEVVIYNAAALEVLDVNIEIRGKSIVDFLKPIDAQKQPVDLPVLLHNTTGPVNNRDLRIGYTDGSVANLFLGISPIYLGYGKAANNGYTLLVRDITREKSLEEERDEFISVVSHELRTPITIAEGNISNVQFMAERSGTTPETEKALNEAHNQVLFLADMINDLSTLSRAERGKLKVDVEPIDVKELVSELGQNYIPEAAKKGLAIATDIDSQLGQLQSSKLYVREILQNFITNAIKYTDTGTVTIHAKAAPKGISFAVQDTGIGISKGDQDRVFDKFFRSEDYRTRKANGTGLGLYVTMKLTRLIHADIELQSELNKGSTFTIFIPDLAVTTNEASAAAAPPA
jgi:signal transduction histidine kinase